MREHAIELNVNNEAVAKKVPANRLLADFLREDLLLTGTKRGCETGICGALRRVNDEFNLAGYGGRSC